MSRYCKVFIAWSEETEAPARALRDRLRERGLSVWLSDEIKPGLKFREELRESVVNAHVVVSVFPRSPSPWQVAEAGLAYFENKLIPVTVDSNMVVEPFRELETHNLRSGDLGPDGGPSVDTLETILRDRLGDEKQLHFFRSANKLFFLGMPLVGIALLLVVIIFGTNRLADSATVEFWRAGHTAFGAIVYGGGAFIALFFSRAGIATSFAERRFGCVAAKRLFALWITVAVLQLGIGIIFLLMVYDDRSMPHWLVASVVIYPTSLLLWLVGYVFYEMAHRMDERQEPLTTVHRQIFLGNFCFGIGILMVTVVILMMSLKENTHLLFESAQ